MKILIIAMFCLASGLATADEDANDDEGVTNHLEKLFRYFMTPWNDRYPHRTANPVRHPRNPDGHGLWTVLCLKCAHEKIQTEWVTLDPLCRC